jgi:hypothetical protein
MVHALLACWRVLQDEGRLLDLRPLHQTRAIELLDAEGKVFVPGHVRDLCGVADDIACAQAVEQVLASGCFARQSQELFELSVYWDDMVAFQAYAKQRYCAQGRLTPQELSRAWEHVRAIAGGHHVRIRYIMHLAVYRKQVPPAVGSD